MNISYDYYRVFYYVAKYRSFTAAARALMSNQPNITRIIKKLEGELGCTLFVRQRHGVSLTREGEQLYAHVAVAYEHILNGEQEIARDKGLQEGIVTVAASEIALHSVLLPALKQFRHRYPGIRLRISNYSTPQAIKVLQQGLADFAVVTEPFEITPRMHSIVLRKVKEVPVCSKALAIHDNKSITLRELAEYPIIGLGDKTGSFQFYSALFQKSGVLYSPDVEAATADQILPMVQADLGIGFVPTDFLKRENTQNLRILEDVVSIPERNICLLWKKDTPLSVAAKELKELVQEQLKGQDKSGKFPSR